MGYVAKRLAALALLLFGVSIAVFAIVRLIPGDPVRVILGTNGGDAETVDRLTRQFGLDQPLATQYVKWIGHVVTGDFGYSYGQQRPVSDLISQNLWPTVQLALAGLLLAIVFGLVIGVSAALRRGSLYDTAIMSTAVTFLSIPSFWLGLLLLLVFAVQIPLFPVAGGAGLSGLVLPAITLGLGEIGFASRFIRSSVIEAGRHLHVVTARAKGLAGARVLQRHVIRNSLLPVITVLGLQFGSLLSGAVLVEIVFSRPGLGRLLVDAILAKDYPTVQACVLLIAVIYSVVNLLVDLLYPVLDPRIGVR
ncbi:ABC transporter permease [Kribbella sp. NPDC050124]|uniref:ABC transporter permease n=1 Tax=Kribbella sp. NPDC050124 TaxID=3364114 RepID=UPI0037B02DF5